MVESKQNIMRASQYQQNTQGNGVTYGLWYALANQIMPGQFPWCAHPKSKTSPWVMLETAVGVLDECMQERAVTSETWTNTGEGG